MPYKIIVQDNRTGRLLEDEEIFPTESLAQSRKKKLDREFRRKGVRQMTVHQRKI